EALLEREETVGARRAAAEVEKLTSLGASPLRAAVDEQRPGLELAPGGCGAAQVGGSEAAVGEKERAADGLTIVERKGHAETLAEAFAEGPIVLRRKEIELAGAEPFHRVVVDGPETL